MINFSSLQQVPQKLNCAKLHQSAPYLLEAPGKSEDQYSSRSVTFFVDSEETFTVSIRARNNEDLVSPPAVSIPVISDQLREYSCTWYRNEIDTCSRSHELLL